jgi:hypothetical protein
MLQSMSKVIVAHKQALIAAIAVTGVLVSSLPFNMEAFAQILIDREIEIPCIPYCNIANEPEDIDIDTPAGSVLIGFSFVPI